VTHESDERFFTDRRILIDAIFGSGLTRPVTGIYAQVIQCINNAKAHKISVDIPSGLMADAPSTGPVVKADFTISFQLPKLSFFFPQYYPFVGEWTLVDINLSKEFIREAETKHFLLTQKGCRKILRKRHKFDHKGTFGHALLIAGSYGKMGAVILSSRAALRAGLGLLTVHIPRAGYSILQTAVPESMVSVDTHEDFFTHEPELTDYSVIGIGPGIGRAPETVMAFRAVLEQFKRAMVIDADALNILGENRELLALVPPGSILTPHPREFERLVGKWNDDFERLEKQRQLASQLQSVIVLKGAFSSITSPDGMVYFNSTGNPGMATGGTGDVLTGILTG
ncbi:MAG: NAD(P)H-hydrate dehydratase, partial [Marivirga sp.]|nr:NAD(P)H-hydrate dehydratase [Marivirga sp.]